MERSAQTHPFPPLYDENARVLILGSFPSVKSREAMFFYGHPQNRFWRVLPALLGEREPQSIAEKKDLVLRRHIALWDSIGSCTVTGSSDASITDVTPNDLRPIFAGADIRAVFCNGGTAYRCYRRFCLPQTGREAAVLPSTSPANARWTLEMLTEAWGQAIIPYLSEKEKR